MAMLTYGLQQSLDGYVDHRLLGPPAPDAFSHFLAQLRGLTGTLYGRQTYEIMRYWDEDQPDWDAAEHEFASAWRNHPKWVASHSLGAVGPNATLLPAGLGAAARDLKARLSGEIAVAGPTLAASLTDLGLIDEYRLYFRPVVLGCGTPFFARGRPPLRLSSTELIGGGMVRLCYVPA